MDWISLFTMQKNLDKYIETNHDLTTRNTFRERCLALLVELGELANETRCFKFWSKKPRSEKKVILEEYVDGIHFILSLGLEKNYYYESKDIEQSSLSETEQFMLVYEKCLHYKNDPTQQLYNELFTSFLQLGQILGFDEEDIQLAYRKKNEINYERQNQGY